MTETLVDSFRISPAGGISMNRFLVRGLVGASLWLAGITAASAQYYGNRDDGYRNDRRWREERYSDSDYRGGNRGYGDYRQAFYDRLQSDLGRAANNGYLSGGDLRRFEQARHEIDEFQDKWGRGNYDRHALDDAIGATQRVANLRGLDDRDRYTLQEDLSLMRRFRARMNGNYGGYGRSDSYRPY